MPLGRNQMVRNFHLHLVYWSIRDHPVNSTSLQHLSILVQPHQKHTTVATYSCYWSNPPRSHGHNVFMVELWGTAPQSRMCSRCFNVY